MDIRRRPVDVDVIRSKVSQIFMIFIHYCLISLWIYHFWWLNDISMTFKWFSDNNKIINVVAFPEGVELSVEEWDNRLEECIRFE